MCKINPVFQWKVARILHWVIVFLVISCYVLGLTMNHITGLKRFYIYDLHVQTGLFLICFTIAGSVWKYTTSHVKVVGRLKQLDSITTEYLYLLIYAFIMIIVMLGVIFIQAKGRHLVFVECVNLPIIIDIKPKAFTRLIFQWHKWLSHMLMVCACLHTTNILLRKLHRKRK